MSDFAMSDNARTPPRAVKRTIRRRFMLISALVVLFVLALVGYGGRPAYAACVNTGGTTYLCSGNETTTQTINAPGAAAMTMDVGATVDTSGGAGDAISITGTGGLFFTNLVGGSINGGSNGLEISNAAGAGGVSITANGAVTGGTDGIDVNNNGAGGVTINVTTVAGDTDGDGSGSGIDVNNSGASTGDVSITAAGTVSGGFAGIAADNNGSGGLTINAASVTGDADGNGFGIGIDAFSGGVNSGDVSITATGAVRGGLQAIRAIQRGTGGVTINAASVTGDADGNGIGDGIDVDISNAASTGDILITANGAVWSGNDGIAANNDGAGGVTINVTTVAGDTDGDGSGSGIDVNNNGASTGDVSITATGTVSGGFAGIAADNNGSGGLTINAASVTGDADGNGFGIGIDAYSGGVNSGDVSITATGAVRSGLQGVRVIQRGTGGVTINAASVTGDADVNGIGVGIDVDISNAASGGDISITATGTVSGGTNGIGANHAGTGALTISAAAVAGNTGRGIQAQSGAGGSVISVSGSVTGGTDGIGVNSTGNNVINIAVGASVTGGTNAINTTVGANGSTDTANNYGAVNAGINLGNGTNVVNNMTGATITGNLTTGTGNDTFSNDGSFTGDANLGDGTNIVTNTSHNSFNGDLTTGVGNDTVTNTGTWTGNVDLGGGTNAFNNSAGGIFNTQNNVIVGAGNVLNNAGTISPGGTGTIQTTALTGDLVQTASSTFAVDVEDTGGTFDRLNVSGTASLAGTVSLNLINLASGQGSVTILSTTGGTTDNGLTAIGSVALNPSLTYPNANDVVLNYNVDFTPASLTGNQTPNQMAVGNTLNTIFSAGSGSMTTLINSLAGVTDEATYLAILDQLQGAHYLNQAALLLSFNHFFVENLLSCPSRLDGAAVEAINDKCLWARVTGQTVDIERTSSSAGGDVTSWGFSGGYEASVGEGLRAGISFAIETIDVGSSNGASSDETRFTAGAKMEKAFGNLEASVGAFGGVTLSETTRRIGLAGVGPATSDHNTEFGGVVGRVSYAHEVEGVRIVPMLDIASTYIRFGGINETGGGAANLNIESSDELVFSATPAIGVLGNIITTEDYRLNASLKGGASIYSSSDISFSSRFAGAPAGTPNFSTSTSVDKVVGNFSGAIELQLADHTSVKVGYEGRRGNASQSHGGYIRAIMPF